MSVELLVISLESSVARRASFAANASDSKISWRFFPAVRTLSTGIVYDEAEAVVRFGRRLHAGEIGVFSSHYKAWKYICENKLGQVIIMEDDVRADWAMIKRVLSCDFTKVGIDYLKLSYKKPVATRILSEQFLGRFLVELIGLNYGAQAYLVTEAGAARFMAACSRMRRPIDDEMDRSWSHGIPTLSIFPHIAFEVTGESTIGAERYATARLPLYLEVKRRSFRQIERVLQARQAITRFGRQTAVDYDSLKLITER